MCILLRGLCVYSCREYVSARLQVTGRERKLITGGCAGRVFFRLMVGAELCEAGTINIGHDNIEI